MITWSQIHMIMPNTRASQEKVNAINDAMVAFGIDQNLSRQAAYIAQVAEETGELRYTREIADGSAYEGRKDLGNTQPGDGHRYRGGGDLEVTGRLNFTNASLACFGDVRLVDDPDLIEQPVPGSMVGAWFWQSHGLNILADDGLFDRITKVINGGTNGAAERVMYWQRAKRILGIKP